MSKGFIKIVDPNLANFLVDLGFQYIKERNVFAFIASDDLMLALQQHYTAPQIIVENKLRF